MNTTPATQAAPAKPAAICCTGNCRQGRDCPNRRAGAAPAASMPVSPIIRIK